MVGRTAPMTGGGRDEPAQGDGRAVARAMSTGEQPSPQRGPTVSRKLAVVVVGSRAGLLVVDSNDRAAPRDIRDPGRGRPRGSPASDGGAQ